MDLLIDRELLAAEAERLGFRVGDDEVEDLIAEARCSAWARAEASLTWNAKGSSTTTPSASSWQYHLAMRPSRSSSNSGAS